MVKLKENVNHKPALQILAFLKYSGSLQCVRRSWLQDLQHRSFSRFCTFTLSPDNCRHFALHSTFEHNLALYNIPT